MTISKRLHFVVATLIVVVVLGAVGGGVVWFSRSQLTKKIIERYLIQESLVTLQVAEEAKDDIETSHSFLSALVNLPEIYAGDSNSCNTRLQHTIPFIPKHINRISRLNAAGIITCSTDRRLIGLNYTIFDSAVKKIISDPDHRPTVGQLIIPPGSEDQTIGFYEPIRDANGSFVGILKAGTKVSTIRERYEKNPAFNYIGEPILLDSDGAVLYSADSEMLSLNVFKDVIATASYDKNILQQIIGNSQKNETGRLEYMTNGQEFSAVHRRIDILPGHSWVFVLSFPTKNIQSGLFPDAYRLIKSVMLANILFVIISLLLFMLYVTRHLIRPEAVISSGHEKHVKQDIENINRAFGAVTKNLARVEEHLEHDINVLRAEAEKKAQDESGKKL